MKPKTAVLALCLALLVAGAAWARYARPRSLTPTPTSLTPITPTAAKRDTVLGTVSEVAKGSLVLISDSGATMRFIFDARSLVPKDLQRGEYVRVVYESRNGSDFAILVERAVPKRIGKPGAGRPRVGSPKAGKPGAGRPGA